MVRTQVLLTEDQHLALKRIYAETGQRITESVRQAVAAYLAGREEMLEVQEKKDG